MKKRCAIMQRVLSVILCATLLIGLFPVNALASSEDLKTVEVTCDKPSLDIGQTAQLSVTLLDGLNDAYSGAADITYTSINPYVATVDQNGLITARNYGLTKITVTAQSSPNTVSKTVTVAVEEQRDGVVTFESMEAGAAPQGMALSNLATVSDYNGCNSSQSAYINDNSNMDTAYMHYQIPTGAMELTLDFDVYVESGVVSLALTNGDSTLSANKAFYIKFGQDKTEMYNGSVWASLKDESGNPAPPKTVKNSVWSHVHIEIINTDAVNGSAKIYVDGEYIGTAAKTIYGGYGRNTGGALDGVYLSSSDNTSIADRCYIDNLSLKLGLTPVGQAEVPLLDVKLGAKVDLALNTERILDDYGNDLGDPNYSGHIDDIVKDYEDGFGFCQIPFGTVTIPSESGDRVFMPYSRSRDGGTTISLDGHKVFETDTILNAADGDDLSQEYLVQRNIKFHTMIEMNDGSGRYFAITYLGSYIDNSTASIRSMIYDPATDEWTIFSGTMHIDSAITGITGPMGSSGFPLVFVKVAYSADGDKLLVAAYSTGGACYMFESDDLGKNWNYRSTIASPKTGEFYHPNGTRLKSFVEPSLERCSDGSLLCLMRTADYQPLWQVRSLDDGLTWGTPERLPGADGVGSIYPVTVKLDNGVLAASTGRFGNTVLFSLDGCGYRWGYATATYWTNDVTTSSGNCSVTRIAPNTLLQTGDYGHQVQNRLAGIWGRVVEVERNDRPNPELSDAILKTDNNRLMVGEPLSVRVEGIFNSNGYLIPADQCEIKYYSESPEILAVDQATGEVAVLSEGLTRVIASVSHDGKTILTNSVAVTAVNENTLNSFTFTVDDWSLDVGQSTSIAASAFNETGAPITSGVSYAFHSASPDIVSVDAGGVVTGVSSGLAVITITATKNNISVSNKTTVIVNSDKWEASDFENCDVGGALPDGYKLLTGNVLPSVSDANAYGSDKSLHFYDSSTSAPASLMRNFKSRTSAVLEYMFYPVKSAGGLWLGMGSGAAGRYLSNISFTDSPGKPGKMRLGYRIASGWVYPVTDLPYNQWYKIRLEGCIGMPSKLFIDDTFICDVGAFPISGGVTLYDLTYVYLMAGSNAGTGDECYIDDIKLMTFDSNTLDSVTATMDDWTLDVDQAEQVTVHAYNEFGDPLDTDVSYTFQSENPGIASVDASGIVTGVSPGVTEIWATAVRGFTSVASKITVVINSSLWETSDFEDCEVGGALPDGYTALISLRPSVSDGNAYSDDKSLHFYDDSTSAPASLMRNFTADKAAVVEYMFYPVKSANGLWLGMGSGAAGRYLSNICFTDSPSKPGKMRLGYNGPGGWVYPVTDLPYNQWYKIRLEGCIGKPSKLFIDDQFICEVGAFPLAASITLTDLTYVYFMVGSNAGTGDECYIDDIKLMSFDTAAGANLKLSELTFDGETIPGFNPDVMEYDITLSEKKKGGTFEAVVANPGSIVNIQTVGDDLVTITVSNGGYEQRYMVNITWQLVEPVDLSSPLYVDTEVGIAPVLPDTVEVTYSDGTTSPAAITWEAIAESKYAEAGTFIVEGTVEGTSLKATAVVTVKADNEVVIESIEGVSVETEVGIAPVLPDTVEVTYSDGTTSPAAVTWEAIAESKYAEAGTFIVEGVVEDTSLKATAVVTVKADNEVVIESIEGVSVETEVGIAPVLPDTVEVTYSDGTTSPAAVTWEAIAESKYAEAGTFTVEGVVEGTSLKATAVVTVKADNEVVIESIEGVSVETEVGIAPVLPDTVEVTYSDGTTSPAAVTWEAIAESKYAEAGTFIVEGTVESTDIKATANVTVTEEDESNSTISPTSATFDKHKPADIEVTMTLNGNTLSAVKNGDVVLVKDKDYTVNGTMVVLKKEYVSVLTGATSQLTFVFSAGDTQEFTINIINTKPGGSTEGGSGITPIPSEPTPIPVKNQDGSASITLNPAIPAGSSTVEAKVDNKLLDKAFELAEADKDGIKEVNLKLAEAAEAETYSVELTVGKLVKDTKNRVINIETPVGTISVNEDMLKGTKEAEDAKVCLNIKKVEGLEGAEGRPVVEITATISAKVIEWNNPDSPVTISIPYKPSAEELKYPEHMTVWYIDGNNKITAVPSGRYDPTTGMVTFKATHFSKYAVAYVKNTFGDIKKYPWTVHSVEVLASKGVIEGVEKDSFKPDQAITRGEYLMWVVKALGLSARFDSNFDDVAKSDSYYEAIGVAKELGITIGVGGNKFAPSAKITRQELMALTAKALKAAGHELKDGSPKDIEKFGDASKVAKSFVNAVSAMVKSGIIVGDGKNVNPGQNTTRAEAAVILYKLYSKSLE